MRVLRTEGIILKRKNLGEADRILTVFTLHHGKIVILAKGIRRITSRRAGHVELLNRVIIYLHQSRGMPIVTEAKSLDTFSTLKNDLTLSSYAYHILELVDKLTAENQENPKLYEHLVEVLRRLSVNPRQILVRAFEAKILSGLGFVSFRNPKLSIPIHPKGILGKLLAELEVKSWDEIENMKIGEKEAMELEHILRYYIERTIEGKLNSRQFLRKI